MERWALKERFYFGSGSYDSVEVVIVRISQGHEIGFGECKPRPRFGETTVTVLSQIEHYKCAVESGVSRSELRQLFPAGAARNGIDSALLDLEARLSGRSVFDILHIPEPRPLLTSASLGPQDLADLERLLRAHRSSRFLKLKVGASDVDEKVALTRSLSPSSYLMVDANETWSSAKLRELMPMLIDHKVALLEQPCSVGSEDGLRGLSSEGLLICADEACTDLRSLEMLDDAYTAVNIKLDKAGGLTEAVDMISLAKRRGLLTMVGCVASTSLSIAPAFALAQMADIVELDAPMLLRRDRLNGFRFQGGAIQLPENLLWGNLT